MPGKKKGAPAQAQTKPQQVQQLLGSIKTGKRDDYFVEAAPVETNRDQMAASQSPSLEPASTGEGQVAQADANESKPTDLMTAEQPDTEVWASPSESPSSMEPILDKPPLAQRIKDALTLVDRVDKQKLCEQLGSPIAEFKAAVTELAEAKIVKDDAISKTLYLLLTEEERKEYTEDVATAKRDDRFQALARIHDHRSYREDYPSWDEFLHHELCLDNPHDWWESEKRQFRIQQEMDAQGLKLKVPLNKNMAQHLNRVRKDAALFVSCVREFQALPQDRQIAKRLGEIVERHLDRKNKLASLRQFVPDATEEELAILAPIYAADHRWRRWYPQVQQQLQERVQTSGRSIRDCMLELAAEIKSLPNDKALLSVARGPDLVPVVNDLMRLLGPWDREQKKKDEIEAWERQGKRLGIYPPATPTPTPTEEAPDQDKPDEEATEDEEDDKEERDEDQEEDEGHEEEEAAYVYDVDLTGGFAEQDERMALSTDELADLLREMADSLDNGWVITRPSTLTVRPAVRQEQSA